VYTANVYGGNPPLNCLNFKGSKGNNYLANIL